MWGWGSRQDDTIQIRSTHQMTLTKGEKERLLESAVEMIKKSGTAGDEEGLEYQAAWLRMNQEWETLMSEYPNQWVAMGKDGVVAVGDSLDDVFAKVNAKRVPPGRIDVKFTDTNPSPLLL